MKLEDISNIIRDLEQKFDLFVKGGVTIASGGDLFIRPTSSTQQKELLSTTSVLNGTLSVTCFLTNSHNSHKVIIRQVPTGDTNTDLFEALEKKGLRSPMCIAPEL